MLNMSEIFFFDVNLSGVKRLPDRLAHEIRKLAPDVQVTAAYLIEDGDPGNKGTGSLARRLRLTGNFAAFLAAIFVVPGVLLAV